MRFVADRRPTVNHDVGIEPHAVAKYNLITDCTKRADVTIASDLRTFGDNRRFVNKRGHCEKLLV